MRSETTRHVIGALLVFVMVLSFVSFAVAATDTEDGGSFGIAGGLSSNGSVAGSDDGSGAGVSARTGGEIAVTVVLPDGFTADGASDGRVTATVGEDGEITPIKIVPEDEYGAGSFSAALAEAVSSTEAFRSSNLTATYDGKADALVISGLPSRSVKLDMNDILTEAMKSTGGYDTELATKYPSGGIVDLTRVDGNVTSITFTFNTTDTISTASYLMLVIHGSGVSYTSGSTTRTGSGTDLSQFSEPHSTPFTRSSGITSGNNGTYTATVTKANGFDNNFQIGVWLYYSGKWNFDMMWNSSQVTSMVRACDAKTIYVSSGGNDSTGDGTEASPFATLTKAYSTVTSGGTIYLLSLLFRTPSREGALSISVD